MYIYSKRSFVTLLREGALGAAGAIYIHTDRYRYVYIYICVYIYIHIHIHIL